MLYAAGLNCPFVKICKKLCQQCVFLEGINAVPKVSESPFYLNANKNEVSML